MPATSRIWRQGAAVLLLSGLSALSLLPAPPAQAARFNVGQPGARAEAGSQRPVEPPSVPGAVSSSAGQAGFAVAMTTVAGVKLAVVGAPGVNHSAGAAYLYVQHGSTWRRQATLTDPGNSAGSSFGSAVAASGRTVVIGAYPAGKVYVYQRSGTTWRLQATFATPEDGSRWYGSSLAISGPTIVVGDPGVKSSSGAAFIYHLAQGAWSQPTALNDPRGTANDVFGTAVAVSGSTMMVGGLNHAYIYVGSGSTWAKQASLNAFGEYFGEALAVSGSTAVVGAWGAYNSTGRAYIFQRVSHTWRQVAVLKNPGHTSLSYFGSAVAISGPRIVVGAPSPISNARLCGTVYEYVRPAKSWRYRTKVTDPGCKRGDQFGYALGLLGRVTLIGAPGKNDNAGSAFEIRVP